MSTTKNAKESRDESGALFPVDAKIAIGMIALGVVGLVLKVVGVF